MKEATFFREVMQDLEVVGKNKILSFLSYPGFHALFVYRICNRLWKYRIPILPHLLSQIIRILYSIEIDYRAKIAGGVKIIHGSGTVIGIGTIERGVVIFHGVTLGHRKSGWPDDGYPTIKEDAFIGAGAKVIGPITVGVGASIGANVVITKDVANGESVTFNKLLRQIVREELTRLDTGYFHSGGESNRDNRAYR